MTHLELRELLVDRIGWKQPTVSDFTVDAKNLTSESGRYFQDEHPSVTLINIHESIERPNVLDAEFNEVLLDMKRQAITLVLSDVYRISDIDDDVLLERELIFDNAISKRMAIIVGETIISSTRSNRTERMTKEFMQKLFFELNGNDSNGNFPNYVGLKSRYGQEINELRDLFDQDTALDSYTHSLPNYEDGENPIIY